MYPYSYVSYPINRILQEICNIYLLAVCCQPCQLRQHLIVLQCKLFWYFSQLQPKFLQPKPAISLWLAKVFSHNLTQPAEFCKLAGYVVNYWLRRLVWRRGFQATYAYSDSLLPKYLKLSITQRCRFYLASINDLGPRTGATTEYRLPVHNSVYEIYFNIAQGKQNYFKIIGRLIILIIPFKNMFL